MPKKKKTGYFVEDHADIMERLRAGTATAADQILAANALQEADQYEDAYHFCTEQIEPYVQRAERPNGLLPASLCDSVAVLLEFWNANRNNPACDAEVMAIIRKALTSGAKYSLAPSIEALAKLDAVSTSTVTQRLAKATQRAGFLAPGFPARLQKGREDAGLSQEELARKIKVQTDTVIAYEAGTRTPSMMMVSRMVDVLNIPLSKAHPEAEPIKVSSDLKHSVDEEME